MSEKYAKEIAKELRLIRVELQKSNKVIEIDVEGVTDSVVDNIEKQARARQMFAGDQVTIK